MPKLKRPLTDEEVLNPDIEGPIVYLDWGVDDWVRRQYQGAKLDSESEGEPGDEGGGQG